MRTATLAAAAAVLLLAAAAPAESPVRSALRAPAYFPLEDGNVWVYSTAHPAGATGSFTVTATLRPQLGAFRRTTTLAGYLPGPPREVRAEKTGVVTERDAAGRDRLWYLLGAPEGTSWTFAATPAAAGGCLSGARLTVAARDETVTVPAGTFAHVVRVDWVPPCIDAGIMHEWFAPGVGLIRREESSVAGPVVSELVSASLAGGVLPHRPAAVTLVLDGFRFVHDLMPPVGPEAVAVIRGALVVHNAAPPPVELVFTGCASATLQLRDEKGAVVLVATASAGGCCACDVEERVLLDGRGLAIPFELRLATPAGEPVPDGRYALTAVLDTSGPEALRFAARVPVEVASVH